jgi:hypothetical protein
MSWFQVGRKGRKKFRKFSTALKAEAKRSGKRRAIYKCARVGKRLKCTAQSSLVVRRRRKRRR